jgi:hypothetical protein
LGSPIGLFDAVKSIATARESCNPLRRISTKEGRLIKLNYVKLILPTLPDPFCSFSSYSFFVIQHVDRQICYSNNFSRFFVCNSYSYGSVNIGIADLSCSQFRRSENWIISSNSSCASVGSSITSWVSWVLSLNKVLAIGNRPTHSKASTFEILQIRSSYLPLNHVVTLD